MFHTNYFVIRALGGESMPHFAVVISNKFAKSSVLKTRLKRIVAIGIEKHLSSDKVKVAQYVFIPKKRILNENGKIAVNVEEISADVYTFLSEVHIP